MTLTGADHGAFALAELEYWTEGFATFHVVEVAVWWSDEFTGDWWSEHSGYIPATEDEFLAYEAAIEDGSVDEQPELLCEERE